MLLNDVLAEAAGSKLFSERPLSPNVDCVCETEVDQYAGSSVVH